VIAAKPEGLRRVGAVPLGLDCQLLQALLNCLAMGNVQYNTEYNSFVNLSDMAYCFIVLSVVSSHKMV